MKKLLLLTLFISSAISCSTHHYSKQWVQRYLVSYDNQLMIAPEDAQLILNLIYFSLARSQATLNAQEMLLDQLTCSWQYWHNMASTRLDPGKQAPYKHIEPEYDAENVKDMHYLHQKANRLYANAVHAIVDGNAVYGNHAYEAITDMRAQARQEILNQLYTIKPHVQNLYDIVSRTTRSTDMYRANWFDTLMSYIPNFAMQTFIDVDTLSNKVGNDSWDILFTIQQANNYVWQAIETTRAEFYRTLYNEAYIALQNAGLPDYYWRIVIDKYGMTAPQADNYLPVYVPKGTTSG